MAQEENKFNLFWELYPRKTSRFVAKRTWNRLSKKDKESILDILPEHLKRWNEKEIQYTPFAKTWLLERRWEDELEPLDQKEKLLEDKLEKQRLKFVNKMKEAEKDIATDDEIRNILLKK